MTTQTQPQGQTTIEVYLEGEQLGEVKHEYLAGQVVAMVGATRTHALIAGSLHAALLPAARRKGCQLFMADMKVRIDHADESYFYYPDVVLSCATADRHPLYTALPCLIVEVLSPSTERIETREKLFAYRLLPSLREYLLLRQDRVHADLYQLGDDGRWQHQVVIQPDEALALCCLDVTVSLRDVYADVPELLTQAP